MGRIETLRKECKAMKTAIEAAKESCERQQGRFEAVDVTLAAGQPRILGLERQVAELRQEVQTLRQQLKEASASTAAKVVGTPSTTPTGRGTATSRIPTAEQRKMPVAMKSAESSASNSTRGEHGAHNDDAVWATNRKLLAKVHVLREQLKAKQAAAACQRSSERLDSEKPCSVSNEVGMLTVCQPSL